MLEHLYIASGILLAAALGILMPIGNPLTRIKIMAAAWAFLALTIIFQIYLGWATFWKAGGAAVAMAALIVTWVARPSSSSRHTGLRMAASAAIVIAIFVLVGLSGI